MEFYKQELLALKKTNRLRERKIYDNTIIDMASNDYLGLSSKKQLLKKAYKRVKKDRYNSSKASPLVNGYTPIHQKFEQLLCKINQFEDAITLGNGFLANISLIEALVRKKDILLIDQEYHASGILATSLAQGQVVTFRHNDYNDLENKIIQYKQKNQRIIIAIEGVYSMSGDIAPLEFNTISKKYNAILIVDEAHSSGVIGDNLLGWYDYYNITIEPYHIKMGTLGKAYGSYGAYILASKHIISYLENRAKQFIYSTAISTFDISLAYENLKYIQKNKRKLQNKITKFQSLVETILSIKIPSLILPIVINDNKKVLQIQQKLLIKGYLIGAIRQPTVEKAILRIILKLDVDQKELKKLLLLLKT